MIFIFFVTTLILNFRQSKSSYCESRLRELEICYENLFNIYDPVSEYCRIMPPKLDEFTKCAVEKCQEPCVEDLFANFYESTEDNVNVEMDRVKLDHCDFQFISCAHALATESPTESPSEYVEIDQESIVGTIEKGTISPSPFTNSDDVLKSEDSEEGFSDSSTGKAILSVMGMLLAGALCCAFMY